MLSYSVVHGERIYKMDDASFFIFHSFLFGNKSSCLSLLVIVFIIYWLSQMLLKLMFT